MTNHEWLKSLTTEELSQFLTFGLQVSAVGRVYDGRWLASLQQTLHRYAKADIGLEDWLKAPQEYEVIK